MLTRIAIVVLLLASASMVGAFEPGSARICVPSADGETFVCREKTASPAADNEAPAAIGSEQAASQPAPATAPASTVTAAAPAAAAAAPPASKLPNYLLQSPGTSRPSSSTAPAPAEVAEPIAAAPADVAATTQEQTGSTATEAPIADAQPEKVSPAQAETIESPAPQPTAVTKTSPAPAVEAPVTSEASATTVPPTAPAEAIGSGSVTEPAAAVEVAPPPGAIRSPRPSLPGASAFLALPATHYTLVLASVRDPSALDALVESLDALPGQLFLIKLGMPDGDWFSLCWSDFADMDAARAARTSLPGDPAITSGWPRRIGPLQKEIAR
jgi:septal ring-binding cell division protein DamX